MMHLLQQVEEGKERRLVTNVTKDSKFARLFVIAIPPLRIEICLLR